MADITVPATEQVAKPTHPQDEKARSSALAESMAFEEEAA